MSDYDYKDGGFVNEAEEKQYIKDLNIHNQQYNNTKPPYLNKDWQYNQYNSILDRFKAMGWTPPSERVKK